MELGFGVVRMAQLIAPFPDRLFGGEEAVHGAFRKKRLAGDIVRQANTSEVTDLRREARDLKEVVAEQTLELRLLKKSMLGDGEELE